ncbi:MAG: hypothetical protein Q9190_002796 [Brigantiaea leucoxantha]
MSSLSEPTAQSESLPLGKSQHRRNGRAIGSDRSDSSDEEYGGEEILPVVDHDALKKLPLQERNAFLEMVQEKERALVAKWKKEGKEGRRILVPDSSNLDPAEKDSHVSYFSKQEKTDIRKVKPTRSFRNLWGLTSHDVPSIPIRPQADLFSAESCNAEAASATSRMPEMTAHDTVHRNFEQAFGTCRRPQMNRGFSDSATDVEDSLDWMKTVCEYSSRGKAKDDDTLIHGISPQKSRSPLKGAGYSRATTTDMEIPVQDDTSHWPLRDQIESSTITERAQAMLSKRSQEKKMKESTSLTNICGQPADEGHKFSSAEESSSRKKMLPSISNVTLHQEKGQQYSAASNPSPRKTSHEDKTYSKIESNESYFPSGMRMDSAQHHKDSFPKRAKGSETSENAGVYTDFLGNKTSAGNGSLTLRHEALGSHGPTEAEREYARSLTRHHKAPNTGNHEKGRAPALSMKRLSKIEESRGSQGSDFQDDLLAGTSNRSPARTHEGNGKGRLEDVSPTRLWKSQAREMGMEVSPDAEHTQFNQVRTETEKVPKAHPSPMKKMTQSIGVGRDWVKSKMHGTRRAVSPPSSPESGLSEGQEEAEICTAKVVSMTRVKPKVVYIPKRKEPESSAGELTSRGRIEKY